MSLNFLILIFFFIGLVSSDVHICDVCTCSEISDVDGVTFVLNIQCPDFGHRTDDLGDLDKIVWPPNPNFLMIVAAFEGLGLSTLGKLPPNEQVESISFSNNAIKTYWPDPLSQTPNIRRLSFAQNDLTEITPDLFTNIDKLEELDLSYNKLTDFNPLDFKSLMHLRKLNVQSNQLRKIPLKALQPLMSLEELDLSKNGIFDLLLQSNADAMPVLKILNLSGNRIRSVVKDSFPPSNTIELIDLSNNVIEIVEPDAFMTCTSLRELNLAQNNITFSFDLPTTLQVIILRINSLHHWLMFNSNIKHIDLAYNKLDSLYDEGVTDLENLEDLNIAGNQIQDFNIKKALPSLLSLDLSYNLLKEVPNSINSNILPSLHELRLDGNPIETIFFPSQIALESLYMSELLVETVEEKAFSNIVPRVVGGLPEQCYSLSLANCPALKEIREGAFGESSLCMLDISNNNLTYLSQNLLNWSTVSKGVNLQFNPWDCSCKMQWVLDELLPKMMVNHSRLLTEFRCHSPRGFEGLRLVHFYNWTQKVMCDEALLFYGPRDNPLRDSASEEPMSSLTMALIGCITVGLLIIVGLMIYLIRNKRRYRLREAAGKRKRQSAQDAATTNGTYTEQFSALNKA